MHFRRLKQLFCIFKSLILVHKINYEQHTIQLDITTIWKLRTCHFNPTLMWTNGHTTQFVYY